MCGPPDDIIEIGIRKLQKIAEEQRRNQTEKEKHLSDVEFVNQNARGK